MKLILVLLSPNNNNNTQMKNLLIPTTPEIQKRYLNSLLNRLKTSDILLYQLNNDENNILYKYENDVSECIILQIIQSLIYYSICNTNDLIEKQMSNPNVIIEDDNSNYIDILLTFQKHFFSLIELKTESTDNLEKMGELYLSIALNGSISISGQNLLKQSMDKIFLIVISYIKLILDTCLSLLNHVKTIFYNGNKSNVCLLNTIKVLKNSILGLPFNILLLNILNISQYPFIIFKNVYKLYEPLYNLLTLIDSIIKIVPDIIEYSKDLLSNQISQQSKIPSNKKCCNDDINWLFNTEKLLSVLMGEIIGVLVEGDTLNSKKLSSYYDNKIYSAWLESDLFKNGIDLNVYKLIDQYNSQHLFYKCSLSKSLTKPDILVRRKSSKSVVGNHIHNLSRLKEGTLKEFLPTGYGLDSYERECLLDEIRCNRGQGNIYLSWIREFMISKCMEYNIACRRQNYKIEIEEIENIFFCVLIKQMDYEISAVAVSQFIAKGTERIPSPILQYLYLLVIRLRLWLIRCISILQLKSSDNNDSDEKQIKDFVENIKLRCNLLTLIHSPSNNSNYKYISNPLLIENRCSTSKYWRKLRYYIVTSVIWKCISRSIKFSRENTKFTSILNSKIDYSIVLLQCLDFLQSSASNDHIPDPHILLLLLYDNVKRAHNRKKGYKILKNILSSISVPTVQGDLIVCFNNIFSNNQSNMSNYKLKLEGIGPKLLVYNYYI